LEKALKDKEQLLEENEKLKEEVKSRENDIEEFEKQNKLLKIAKSIESLEGKKEVKQKINELVREIDNCIALLNR
jgi:cell division septum initiation protein DivIVA